MSNANAIVEFVTTNPSWSVLAFVLATLGGGAGFRRLISKDARDRAKNEAEGDWFGTAISEVRADRDAWKKSAEEAWELVRKREAEVAVARMEHKVLKSQMKMVNRLMEQFPELAVVRPLLFDSGPGNLDSRPHTDVVKSLDPGDRTG